MVDHRGYDSGSLHQITALDVVVNVHIGMVCPRVVFERLLNKLKSGNAHVVKG
jgi:hypothetical protein